MSGLICNYPNRTLYCNINRERKSCQGTEDLWFVANNKYQEKSTIKLQNLE